MKIQLDSRHEREYHNLCLTELKKQYYVQNEPYTERKIVENSCKICIDILVKEFEQHAATIISTYDVSHFLYSYASYSNPIEEGLSNADKIIFRMLCRFLFGEFTKTNIICNNEKSESGKVISRLFFITKLINKYSDILYEIYITNNYVSQLELYNDDFAITINDDDYYQKQQQIKMNFSPDWLKGACFVDEYFNETLNSIELYFGDAASSIFALFMENTNSDNDDRCRTLEVTDIVNKFKLDPFINGLILRKQNVNLRNSIHKPHDINLRSRFRPIIEVKVNGIERYVTTKHLIFEALDQLITNQIPFGELPKEWLQNPQIVKYSHNQQNIHDKWLENPTEIIISKNKFIYLRNVENINGINIIKASVGNSTKTVGEIDFIIVDSKKSTIYIADCKYIKRKDNFASFAIDRNSFEKEKGYNTKLANKIDWISNHKSDLAKELQIDLSLFTVEGLFITNSYVYYGNYSRYPIIAIDFLNGYFDTGKYIPF